jgi:hypothetical protein
MLVLSCACRATAAPSSDPIAAAAARSSLALLGDRLQAELDQRVRAARFAAGAAPEDARRLDGASYALFLAADLCVQRAVVDELERSPDLALDEVLRADERVSADVRRSVLQLAEEGRAHAERTLAHDPTMGVARLHLALHLSLQAWAQGTARAALSGTGSRAEHAIEAALATLDPSYHGAAPLRLAGRFFDRAPWPVHDGERARDLLERAVALASIPLNELFLGDALHGLGRTSEAKLHWRAAQDAASDASTAHLEPFVRFLAAQRLARWPTPRRAGAAPFPVSSGSGARREDRLCRRCPWSRAPPADLLDRSPAKARCGTPARQ